MREVLPPGWVCNFRLQAQARHRPQATIGLGDMEWKIAPEQRSFVLTHDYLLRVTPDRSLFMIVCGNSDAGPWPRAVLTARLLYVESLDWYPLARFVADTLEQSPPNTWGLS